MNTRFNPTTNGYLHIGHLYVLLLNYHTAIQNGGKFICRFDDDQYIWLERLGREKIDHYCESIKEELDWLEIPTIYTYESKEKEANEELIKKLGKLSKHIPASPEELVFPEILSQNRPYPYVPYLTAVKVAQDYREEINPLIRGDDLITEFSLYHYFCDALELPVPKMIFVPKLMHQKSCFYSVTTLEDLSDVSKTQGGHKIRDFREKGMKPKELIKMLSGFCLKEPQAAWTYGNVKKQPILQLP